jgi:hypothetical protein
LGPIHSSACLSRSTSACDLLGSNNVLNIDSYTFTDDVAGHFAGDENNEQTAVEILVSAIDSLADGKLTGFALRLALTTHGHSARTIMECDS